MPGPAPKPTKLKIREGNRGHRPLNTKEPEPAIEAPECPDIVKKNKVAIREWQRVVPILIELEVLSRLDSAVLAEYCIAYSRWVMAEAKCAENLVYESKGRQYETKWLKVAKDAAIQMHKCATEFGLTPASRTRVQIENKHPGATLKAFLGARPA